MTKGPELALQSAAHDLAKPSNGTREGLDPVRSSRLGGRASSKAPRQACGSQTNSRKRNQRDLAKTGNGIEKTWKSAPRLSDHRDRANKSQYASLHCSTGYLANQERSAGEDL